VSLSLRLRLLGMRLLRLLQLGRLRVLGRVLWLL
jgi:hypothetical protein